MVMGNDLLTAGDILVSCNMINEIIKPVTQAKVDNRTILLSLLLQAIPIAP
jgi:hypothetical protein